MTETRKGRLRSIDFGEKDHPWTSPVAFSMLMPKPGWIKTKAVYSVSKDGKTLDYEMTFERIFECP